MRSERAIHGRTIAIAGLVLLVVYLFHAKPSEPGHRSEGSEANVMNRGGPEPDRRSDVSEADGVKRGVPEPGHRSDVSEADVVDQGGSPRHCVENPFLSSFSVQELKEIEQKTAEYAQALYGQTAALYTGLIECQDEGKSHPTSCPVREPSGPHIQYKFLRETMPCLRALPFGAAGSGDGQKYICSPDVLPKDHCVVYSLGSAGDFSFEQDVVKRTGCTVHTFDCTISRQSGPLGPRLEFHDLCISGSDEHNLGEKYKSVPTIMSQLGHSQVHVLKMDIEGFEQDVFAGWRSWQQLPHIVLVEVHGNNPAIRHHYRKIAFSEMNLLFLHLLQIGYRVAKYDLQPNCSNCVEIVLIRTICPAKK